MTILALGGVRAVVLAATSALWAVAASAQQQTEVKGVNPAENISRLEVIPKYDRKVGSISVPSLAFKYDQAVGPHFAFNLEVPLVGFRGQGREEGGLGDVQFRVRYIRPLAQKVFGGGGAEFVAPSASADVLGRGKWQVNPTLVVVHAWSRQVFTAGVYKHFISVDGQDDRRKINESNIRLLQGYSDAGGWWVLGDLKFEYDHVETRGRNRRTLVPEVEAGIMLGPASSIAVRLGTTLIDRTSDYVASASMKWFF
jgi:hypothetical protein